MQVVVILCCLGNNDKKKCQYMFSTGATIIGLTITAHVSNNASFFLNVFNLQLVESPDVEPADMKSQQYL